ncbi:MAG: hypothetical protein Q7S03_00775 [bacterium]|nr:hypothetical protein [bacterium]
MPNPILEIKSSQIALPLPKEAKVSVEKGAHVSSGEVLAETPDVFQECNLAKALKTSPQKVDQSLVVATGTFVKEGEIIARRKTLLSEIVFKSPATGFFSELLPEGVIKIKVGDKTEIRSPAKGIVLDVQVGNVLTLECDAVVLTGVTSFGLQTEWGQVEILNDQEKTLLANLPQESSGKIFVARGKVDLGFVHKAEALGASGIICNDLEGQLKRTDLAIIALEDKAGKIGDEVWKVLKKYNGKRAVVMPDEKIFKIPLN